jgi:hypothetical protein
LVGGELNGLAWEFYVPFGRGSFRFLFLVFYILNYVGMGGRGGGWGW